MASQKEEIEQILDEIRPQLARHQGGVELVSFDEKEKVVSLKMEGACVGCALSQMTMKAGIEGVIRGKFPDVTVVDVSDHSSGKNPFYENK
ncbi:NifU family protein [Candidatus Uhrbacteria bacterium]|jgi:Fe-S cluster biogenesis protein NfuA|nr:NifU family protein [Candidatus Uhrbacteria bacterium]